MDKMNRKLEDLYRILDQDIGFEDITTQALIPPGLIIKARIISKQEGVVAGLDLISSFFKEFEIEILDKKDDGANIKVGETLLEIEGDAQTILSLERTILNLLMRMSGVATTTSKMVHEVKKINPEIILAGTRKTTPGLQFWEKEAVRLGGADTHRYRLDDAVLIKDNHLALVGDVAVAIRKAKKYASFTKKIEIEVENLEDALKAAEAGADIIMLDNMDVKEIEKVLKSLKSRNLRDKVIVEVSGGINQDNVVKYAETNVDVISSGYIVHSAESLDLSLDIIF